MCYLRIGVFENRLGKCRVPPRMGLGVRSSMNRKRSAGGLYLESTKAEQLGVLPGEDRPVHAVMRRRVVTIEPSASIRRAVETMYREDVPALIVQGVAGLQGVLTERDIAARAAKEGSNPAATVREFLPRRKPITCLEEDIIADALALMKRHHLSAVPVRDDHGAVVGVLSLIDIAASLAPDMAPVWLNEVRKNSSEI